MCLLAICISSLENWHGAWGLHDLIPGECREPTKRKTKGTWGNRTLMSHWACFHNSSPREQRDTEPERDTHWKEREDVDQSGGEEQSQEIPEASCHICYHYTKTDTSGLRKAFLNLIWSGKLISLKNNEKVFEVKSQKFSFKKVFSFKKKWICRITFSQAVKERHAHKNRTSCHPLFPIKLRDFFKWHKTLKNSINQN